jgi:hypothetical protein
MEFNKTTLVYLLQQEFRKNAPVRTRPLGAIGDPSTPFYSARPGWLRDTGWYLTSDSFVLSERLVGYIGYANKRSKRPNFIEKTNNDFLATMRKRGAKIEQI